MNNLLQIKFFVARKTFREAVKPFDIKDVIEQYNVGHLDLCNRVKHLHARYHLQIRKKEEKLSNFDFIATLTFSSG
jgi:hypothetical protein